MGDLNFPNASEFSPNVVDLATLLEMCKNYEEKTSDFLSELKKKYFSGKAPASQNQLTNNCRSALVAYGILSKGEIKFTDFGEKLYGKRANSVELYNLFAKHILQNLNGLILVNTIQDMGKAGTKVKNESIIEELNSLGASMAESSKKISSMKTWLEKAGVFEQKSWRINQSKVDELTGLTEAELSCFRELTHEQISFIKALNNTGVVTGQKANEIKKLATATYRTVFPEKNFSSLVLKQLEEKALIIVIKATDGRGGKSPTIKPTKNMLLEVTVPYLQQLEKLTSPELVKCFKLSFEEILRKVKSKNKHTKGLALEALAYKLMKLVGMEFVETRLRSEETGGAEVDLLFDSRTLVYSRWQIQCKNSATVSLDAVAKEVGLTHLLKSNAIVMIGTGSIGNKARQYADIIMRESNLCIVMLDGKDLETISKNPTAIVDVFNRESQNAKNIKILDV